MGRSTARAFENIISILSKIPWDQPNLMTSLERDHLFELAKLGVDARMQNESIIDGESDDLLVRLVRAGLCVPLFSEKQKLMLLGTSKIKCPPELTKYVFVIAKPDEIEAQPANFRSGKSIEATKVIHESAKGLIGVIGDHLPTPEKRCDILGNEWSLEGRIRQLKIKQLSLNDQLIAARAELIDVMSEIQVARAMT